MITIVIATHLIVPLITTVLNSMSWYVCFFLEKQATIALFTIIRTDRNMLLACYSHKHISYRIRTIIRKAIDTSRE
ncbi:hypothetical protein [Wolbachia endosymbiont (group A) of Scambus nigricans]|uniref:hypothetical protein n=1 Tax=Wolbachia endosymbiont (group A) of Scambus nigricans TaxID=2954055 RepID=UPI00222F741A|nr:hypothetical protein [Wolbachia endosymbiont (group A) of Scambus nigricans]